MDIRASNKKVLSAQKAKNCTATYKERGAQSESKTSRVWLQLMAPLIGGLRAVLLGTGMRLSAKSPHYREPSVLRESQKGTFNRTHTVKNAQAVMETQLCLQHVAQVVGVSYWRCGVGHVGDVAI